MSKFEILDREFSFGLRRELMAELLSSIIGVVKQGWEDTLSLLFDSTRGFSVRYTYIKLSSLLASVKTRSTRTIQVLNKV